MITIWQPEQAINKGRYSIEQVLGIGGFGITYKAKDTSNGEILAIKTLNHTVTGRFSRAATQVY